MTITHGMSLLSIEEQDREAASRIEEAQAMEERTARPGPSCSAALKLNGVKRPQAAADDQPLNAGLHASQLCDNRLSGAEALHEWVNIELLKALDKDAEQFDEQGCHKDAEMMRSAARRLRERISLTQAGDAPPAQDPDPVAQWRERSFWETVVFLQKEAQRKAVPVSMGKLDTRQWLEMQSATLLDIAIAEELPVTRAPPVPDYFWVDSDKRIQCERHIHHLRKVVRSSSSETEWVNAARDYPELLSCHTLGYNITAASDLIAVNCSAIRDGLPQSGIRLLMDIKQGIAASDVNQAQARLLLGNLHSPESRPALVLTDMNDEWHAIWLDGSTIYQHTFASRGRAVGFIDDLLAGRFETCGDISQTSFAKRRHIDDRLCDSCARDAAFAQQVEALGVRSPTPSWA